MSGGADIKERALGVTAPLASHVYVLAVTDTVARFAIPAAMAGRFITLMMDGSDADVVFGDSGVSCAYGQTSSVTSEAITVSAASGMHIKNGVYSPRFQAPTLDKATHFAVDCKGSGSGNLYIVVG